MKYFLASIMIMTLAGCVVDEHRKQQIDINIVVRGIDVKDPESKPGTAEVGGSYKVNW